MREFKETLQEVIDGVKLPISNHPLVDEKYSIYSKAYNRLSRKLQKAKIDIKELFRFANACGEYERLGYLAAYERGYRAAEAEYISSNQQVHIDPVIRECIREITSKGGQVKELQYKKIV